MSLCCASVAAACHAPAARDSTRAPSALAPPAFEAPSASATLSLPAFETGGYPWLPDRGDGTYSNPVIFADYSDPDVIRAGDAYYLVASSFNCTPALPILRSLDLVNWKLVGHALENLSAAHYAEVEHGAGVWAPALREHAGTFYLLFPTPDEGIYVLRAAHPEGPWGEPRLLLEGKGLIDPCPFWDDDGKAYLVHAYARSRAGIKDRLRIRPMAPDASAVIGEGEIVFHDPARHPTLEGPKLYKRNGWYYILAPAGGVSHGWQVALRSRSIYGPYEDRVVLQQGATPINGPHQGAWVDTPAGDSWFVHFQDLGVYGRVVHLNPIQWQDDWPLMGVAGASGIREPVLHYTKPSAGTQSSEVPATSDEFASNELGLQWQWQANHRSDWWSLAARPGHLRLFAQRVAGDDLQRAANLLLQKLPAPSFTAETRVELGGAAGATRAGLVMMGQSAASLTVQRTADAMRVAYVVDQRVLRADTLPLAALRLGVSLQNGGACRFYYQADTGSRVWLEPGFQARAGRWIGAKLGIFALTDREAADAFADFDYFRFRAVDETATPVMAAPRERAAPSESNTPSPGAARAKDGDGAFRCTLVLGVAVTGEWFNAGFEQALVDGQWEAIVKPHTSLEQWADPADPVWQLEPVSACSSGAAAPDRVLFTGMEWKYTTREQWEAALAQVVQVLLRKYPALRRIELLTMIRAPGNQSCGNAMSVVAPFIDQAVERVSERFAGRVRPGPRFEAPSCDAFKNGGPHFTAEGRVRMAQLVAAHYAAH